MKTDFRNIKNNYDLENYLDYYCDLGWIVRERDDKENNNMLWEILHCMLEDGSYEDVLSAMDAKAFTELRDKLECRRSKWAKEWVEMFQSIYEFLV